MKKLLSVILAVIMVVSAAPMAFAADSDGVPTVIDVSEKRSYDIVSDDYDPDGYILTGENPDADIFDYVGVDITFKDVTFGHYFQYSENAESVTVTLEGNNVMTESIHNDAVDIVINAEEGATLDVYTNGYFVTNDGWGGELVINSGDINITVSTEQAGHMPTVNAPYIQNGGNVTISSADQNAFQEDIMLNGGTLTASSETRTVVANMVNVIIAPGAKFKGFSPVGIFPVGFKEQGIFIAEGAPENSCLFAKTSEDGDFTVVTDSAALKTEKYLEIKVDTHIHDLNGGDECSCGLKKADYSGYSAAYDRFQSIAGSADLNDNAISYISIKHDEMVEEHLNGGVLRNNYLETEQYILDGLEADFNEMSDTLEEGIADGSFIKPNYSELESKIAEFEKTHPGDEYKEVIAEMKADLEAIKARNPESQADIQDELDAFEEKIDKINDCNHMCHKGGIMGFFWKISRFFMKLFGSNPVCECGMAHY